MFNKTHFTRLIDCSKIIFFVQSQRYIFIQFKRWRELQQLNQQGFLGWRMELHKSQKSLTKNNQERQKKITKKIESLQLIGKSTHSKGWVKGVSTALPRQWYGPWRKPVPNPQKRRKGWQDGSVLIMRLPWNGSLVQVSPSSVSELYSHTWKLKSRYLLMS